MHFQLIRVFLQKSPIREDETLTCDTEDMIMEQRLRFDQIPDCLGGIACDMSDNPLVTLGGTLPSQSLQLQGRARRDPFA